MKKYKLLSLLTAIAIVITTTCTYAAWDSLSAETDGSVTFRNPVTVTVNQNYTLEQESAELDKTPTASGTVSFAVSNKDSLADTLTIVPTVSGGSATVDNFEFEIVDKDDSSKKLTGDASNGFVDKSLNSTNYTVKVTPKTTDISGQAITVKLTATLSKSN